MLSKFKLAFLLLSGLLLLSGCVVANKIVAPYTDLDITVADDLNPDISGRASPVVIKIYQLAARTTFDSKDFFQLYENPQEQLGEDLLASEDLELQPDDHVIHTLHLKPGTQYVGIVVAFRDIEKAKWRLVAPVDERDYDTLNLALDSLSIHLIDN